MDEYSRGPAKRREVRKNLATAVIVALVGGWATYVMEPRTAEAHIVSTEAAMKQRAPAPQVPPSWSKLLGRVDIDDATHPFL